MLAKRIIAALDIKDGRVVKGVNFKDIRDAGDPVELAKRYEREGIDEIVFLDINASDENRQILLDIVEKVASNIYVPFTVGGGVKSVEGAKEIVKKGADKVFINTAAVEDPELVKDVSDMIGTANLVIAIDAKWNGEMFEIYTHGGRRAIDIDAVKWAQRVEDLGAGEILLTSMDADGTQDGYDIGLTEAVNEAVDIPVIASGGAGSKEHVYEVFETGVSAALAASIFHYEKHDVEDLKNYLQERDINVRL